jgi:hypothetical protein
MRDVSQRNEEMNRELAYDPRPRPSLPAPQAGDILEFRVPSLATSRWAAPEAVPASRINSDVCTLR